MALGKNNTGNNVVYVSIINGKFTIKSKTKEPGTIPRINKNGEEIYEYHYDYLDGVVKGIQIFEGNYGKEFILTLTDVGEVYKIKIPINTKYFISIVEKLGSLRESVIYMGMNQKNAFILIEMDCNQKMYGRITLIAHY